jgi:hypothetical protein
LAESGVIGALEEAEILRSYLKVDRFIKHCPSGCSSS